MLKKNIKYVDYDGNKREEDFYFNLTQQELIDMEVSEEGGYGEYIKRIVASKKEAEIIKVLKSFIHKAYGKKSEDGRRFIKSEDLLEEFKQTEAYSQLFMELASNADAASAFFNAIVPAKVAEEMQAELKRNPVKAE